MTKSKFAELANLHRERSSEEPEIAVNAEDGAPAKQGRGRGKSSSGEYQKTTILLHSDVYHAVQTKLLSINRGKAAGAKKDMSDVINALLRDWTND